jgi:hypothetical protein
VTNSTGRPLVQYELDPQGTGSFGPPVSTLDGVQTTYTVPGLVFPVLRATDDRGTEYTATTLVNALPRSELDALLRGKWNGMKAALTMTDIEGALRYFVPSQQVRYRAIFTALSDQLSQLAVAMEEITLVELLGRQAQYRIPRMQLWGGELVRVSYYLFFVLGDDGIWRIRDF